MAPLSEAQRALRIVDVQIEALSSACQYQNECMALSQLLQAASGILQYWQDKQDAKIKSAGQLLRFALAKVAKVSAACAVEASELDPSTVPATPAVDVPAEATSAAADIQLAVSALATALQWDQDSQHRHRMAGRPSQQLSTAAQLTGVLAAEVRRHSEAHAIPAKSTLSAAGNMTTTRGDSRTTSSHGSSSPFARAAAASAPPAPTIATTTTTSSRSAQRNRRSSSYAGGSAQPQKQPSASTENGFAAKTAQSGRQARSSGSTKEIPHPQVQDHGVLSACTASTDVPIAGTKSAAIRGSLLSDPQCDTDRSPFEFSDFTWDDPMTHSTQPAAAAAAASAMTNVAVNKEAAAGTAGPAAAAGLVNGKAASHHCTDTTGSSAAVRNSSGGGSIASSRSSGSGGRRSQPAFSEPGCSYGAARKSALEVVLVPGTRWALAAGSGGFVCEHHDEDACEGEPDRAVGPECISQPQGAVNSAVMVAGAAAAGPVLTAVAVSEGLQGQSSHAEMQAAAANESALSQGSFGTTAGAPAARHDIDAWQQEQQTEQVQEEREQVEADNGLMQRLLATAADEEDETAAEEPAAAAATAAANSPAPVALVTSAAAGAAGAVCGDSLAGWVLPQKASLQQQMDLINSNTLLKHHKPSQQQQKLHGGWSTSSAAQQPAIRPGQRHRPSRSRSSTSNGSGSSGSSKGSVRGSSTGNSRRSSYASALQSAAGDAPPGGGAAFEAAAGDGSPDHDQLQQQEGLGNSSSINSSAGGSNECAGGADGLLGVYTIETSTTSVAEQLQQQDPSAADMGSRPAPGVHQQPSDYQTDASSTANLNSSGSSSTTGKRHNASGPGSVTDSGNGRAGRLAEPYALLQAGNAAYTAGRYLDAARLYQAALDAVHGCQCAAAAAGGLSGSSGGNVTAAARKQQNWPATGDPELSDLLAATKLQAGGGVSAAGGQPSGGPEQQQPSRQRQEHRADDGLGGDDDEGAVVLRFKCSLNLAACYLRQGHLRQCVAQCDSLLDVDASNVVAVCHRGRALLMMQQHAAAKADLSSALALLQDREGVTKEGRSSSHMAVGVGQMELNGRYWQQRIKGLLASLPAGVQ